MMATKLEEILQNKSIPRFVKKNYNFKRYFIGQILRLRSKDLRILSILLVYLQADSLSF